MTASLEGKAIIFDLDGTLVDTAGDLAASMNHVLAELDVAPVAPDKVRGLVGHGAKAMLRRGFELNGGTSPSEELLSSALSMFLAHYEQNIAVQSRPFDGVLALIDDVKSKGAAVSICTNKRERFARLLLQTLKMDHLFEAIVGADTASAPKPDPAPVIYCLQASGAKDGVFIGDSDTDIRAAKAAGLPCLIADFGYGPLSLADEAAAQFSHYDETPQLIYGLLEDGP